MKKRVYWLLFACMMVLRGTGWAEMGVPMAFDDPFVHLCARGSAQQIRAALLKGANPNGKDSLGRSALVYAASENKPEVVSLLLKAGAEVNVKDFVGQTALMYAAMNNTVPEIFSLLLKAGADVNAKDMAGGTALMYAAAHLKTEIISLLLKAGADINAKDNKGKTALDYARGGKNAVAIKALEDATQQAAQSGDPETLYQLGIRYATGDGVKEDTQKGIELLRKAASMGHQKAKDALKLFGESELTMKGTAMSDEEFLKLCQSGSAKEVSDAIKDGADPNASDAIMTALMAAAGWNKNPEVISLLLEVGADVNANDEYGMTALMYAAVNNENPKVLSVLLTAGADPNARDEDDKTALDWAREKNNKAAIKVLEAAR